jgi:hypothetical protein
MNSSVSATTTVRHGNKLSKPAEGGRPPLVVGLDQALLEVFLAGHIAIPLAEVRELGLAEADVNRLVLAGGVTWCVSKPATRSETRTASEPDLSAAGSVPQERPVWDAKVRELWWRGQLVKRFWHTATNQCLLFAAFERLGWPRRIDNPFPQGAKRSAKGRLRGTLKALRISHNPVILRFRGDGTGQGVRWEPTDASLIISPPTLPQTDT